MNTQQSNAITDNNLKSNEHKKWFGIALETLQLEDKLNRNGLPPFVEEILEHIEQGMLHSSNILKTQSI